MLNVIMLSVVMLSVVAPQLEPIEESIEELHKKVFKNDGSSNGIKHFMFTK
jgi:hypothetical protein